MPKKLEEQTAEELIAYIKNELRPELKSTRERAEAFEDATKGLTPATVGGFLNIISTFGKNPAEGAEKMERLAQRVKGTSNQSTKETEVADNQNEEVPAWAQELIDQNAALREEVETMKTAQASSAEESEKAEIARLKGEAKAMGFEEDTDEWVAFWRIAGSDLADGDLARAAQLYEKLEGPLPGSEDNKEEEGEEGTEGAEEPTFPATGGAGGSGTPGEGAGEEPAPVITDKKTLAQMAMAKLQAVKESQDGSTTP